MEATTVANNGAVSISIEVLDAGSISYNNEQVTASSSPNNQELNFKLLDSLYFAAADGDINKFQEHSRSLDQIVTPNGNTILHIHITARPRRISHARTTELDGNDFVRGVLEMCPDLRWKANNKGETLLHMAARHGHADVVNHLLDECEESSQSHDQGLGTRPTRLMLQRVNEAKDTALHEAVRNNHLDVVRILTKEDPSLPYEANTASETPLYLAAERGYADVLKWILRSCDSPADHGPYCRTALHAAVINFRHHYAGRIRRLLLNDERIQKSIQDQQGWTALHFAAHFGRLFIVKKLIMKDESAAYKADNEGKTALHVAASLGRVDVMRELITKCPSCCELVDNRGWNVLHFATTSKNRKAVGLILQNLSLGNLVNEKDKKGNTPFLQAASMRLILTHPKVDTLVFNNDNQNASHMVDPLSIYPWPSIRELGLWHSIRYGIRKCRRIVSKEDDDNEEGKENRNDTESSQTKNEAGKNDLVAATLIATVTFAAGITVPGGFVADKDEGPVQGSAILTRNTAFRAFVILNTISMILSSLAVFHHISRRPATTRIELRSRTVFRGVLIALAMRAMIGAFFSATYAVLHSDKYLAISASLVGCCCVSLPYIPFKIFKMCCKKGAFLNLSTSNSF